MRTVKMALLILTLAVSNIAYAAVPDVSNWNCPAEAVERAPELGVEVCFRDGGANDLYIKVDGEVVFVHQHLVVNEEARFYSAIKTNAGEWKEMTTARDELFDVREEEDRIVLVMTDDNGNAVGTRFIPKKN